MASDLTPAIWAGPYPAELPDMSIIYPGEEHLVTSEDLKSDHWKAVTPPAQSAPSQTTAPVSSPSSPSSQSTSSSPPSPAASGGDS